MYSESRKNTMIESIKINGIIEPIVVRKTENGKYQDIIEDYVEEKQV